MFRKGGTESEQKEFKRKHLRRGTKQERKVVVDKHSQRDTKHKILGIVKEILAKQQSTISKRPSMTRCHSTMYSYNTARNDYRT